MAGKKRRKSSGSTGKTSSKRKSGTSTGSEVPIPVCSTILRHVLDIASSRNRAGHVLQSFLDGKCWIETKKIPTNATFTVTSSPVPSSSPTVEASKSKTVGKRKQQMKTNVDCYWIILAINAMNRLLVLVEQESSKEAVVTKYLVALSDVLATILLSDKLQLEKCSHQSASRSILCRAILTTTNAAMYGIRNYDPQQHPRGKHDTFITALATLDRLVHLRGRCGNYGIKMNATENGQNTDDDTDSLSTIGNWTESALGSDCSLIEEFLGLEGSENSVHDCVKILLETTKQTHLNEGEEESLETEKPAGKRSTRARSGGKTTKSTSTKRKSPTKKITAPSEMNEGDSTSNSINPLPIVSAFEKLLASEDFGGRIDGRIALKRWAGIAVVWSQRGDGQNTILRAIHELCTGKHYENVFTTVQKSRLISTLISIVNETGTQCGARPPSGSIEQYLGRITSSLDTSAPKTRENTRSKRSKKSTDAQSKSPLSGATPKKYKSLRRTDIRDWTTVVIYDYLQNHKKCLLETVTLTRENEPRNNSIESSSPVPKLSDLMTGLCRSASSSVQNASYSQQNSWKKTLLSIAAAYCFEMSADPGVPLDSKMLNFALAQFVDNMRMMEPHTSIGITSSGRVEMTNTPPFVSEKQIRDFETKHSLRIKLSKPSVPQPFASNDATSTMDLVSGKTCMFAGLLSDESSFSDEKAIALAIRAVQGSSCHGNPSSATGKLLTYFINLVKRAYDTTSPEKSEHIYEEVDNVAKSSPGGKRKRSATKCGTSNRRGGRRRKVESGEAQEVSGQDKVVWNRIDSEKASIAMAALHAIRMWLMNTKRLGSFPIRRILRNTVTTDHLLDLVKLGETLEKIIIKTRCPTTDVGKNSKVLSNSSSSTCEDFTSSEILLWNAHMSTCQVFGRGQLTYAENNAMDAIIWSAENRMIVYKAIADRIDSSNLRGTDKVSASLPAAHHALLAANMSCVLNGSNKDPEKHLVSSYINSITRTFGNLHILVPKDWGLRDRIIDDDVPLSYNDARTFMLALHCLSFKEKCRCLELLVSSALDCLKPLVENRPKREALLYNAEISGFIARVLVFCYSLVNCIGSGKGLEEVFIGDMGCAQINMPSFVTRDDWYRQDRTFMGIFDAWESPSLPENLTGKNSPTPVPKKSLSDFRSLLEITFSMGFDAAPHDHCHLLFTAWNGLDQVPGTSGLQNSGARYPTLTTSMEDFPKKILQLREDIFSVYKATNDVMPVILKGMLSNACELTDLILKNHVADAETMTEEMSLPVMVLLAALPTYIAAGISGYTKPGNDYFSTTMSKSWTKSSKRHRGYSSESDPPPSECDSDEDADDYENEVRLDAISRLKECCDAFGAAPIHPDWLDVSCSFRDGIRPSDAIEVATKAIKTLSHLITIAFTQCKRHQSWAMQKLLDRNVSEQSANFCTTLLRWSRHEIGPSQYPNDREWLKDLTSVTKIPQKVVEHMLEEVPARDLIQTKACWCPYAGQKVRGLLQEENGLIGGWETTDAELRAGGEWELLLAEALCVSCLRTNQNGDKQTFFSEGGPFIGHESSSEMAKAQLWRTVFMSATSHLVPAAALLRLGLGKVGRKPHPFALHENNQDPYESAPLHFSESLNRIEAHSSSSLRSTVCETLSLLARLSIEDEESLSITCHAVASHLVVDTNTFSDLEAMSSMKCALMGLKLMREIAKSSPKKDVKAAIPFVVERLVSIMEHSGRGGIGVSKGRANTNSTNFGRLNHFLGDPPSCLIETIANKSPIDIFKILKSGGIKEICEDQVETYKWLDETSKEDTIGELVSMLCGDSLRANCRTRSHVALILSRIGIIESQIQMSASAPKHFLAIRALIQSFNKVDEKKLKSIILNDLCCIRGSKVPPEPLRKDIASIFSLLLFSRSSPKFEKAKFVHDTLMTMFDSWGKISRSNRELTLEVFMMYGTRFNSIFEIGSKLVEHIGKVESQGESNGEAELVSKYFASVKSLQEALTTKDKIGSKTSNKNFKTLPSLSSEGARLPSEFPKSCSFIQKSGFHGQHWYHCHTCGLVADKGCCTLCALVCHRGHDVTYSRYSSFFCDCAAEDGSSAEQNRVSCKCLSTLSSAELNSLHDNERLWMNRSVSILNRDHEKESGNCIYENSVSVDIAKHYFADTASKAVDKFLLDIKTSQWQDCLFRVLNNEFVHWKAKYGDTIRFLLQKCSEANPDPTPILRLSHDSCRRKLRERRSKPLKLERMNEKGFVSLSVATGFLAKPPSDSNAHDALALARLSRNSISRSILAFDSRGRMIIAEPCSLVFCSAMAAVDSRNLKKPCEEHFTRHQMCILGTASLSFNVLGLRICTENERHIIVWGTSDVCMLVLKKDYSGVEDKITLTFEVDDQDRDGDVLVNCEWLPGSQTHVAVGVSRYIRLFDVSRFESTGDTKKVNPVIGYNLGFEASLRDLCIVPQKDHTSSDDDDAQVVKNREAEHTSKMFLLLENGRLHSLDIKISSGKIESPSELHFEPSECVSISTEGIRPRAGSSIGLPGALTRTLGEGSKLVYLKQSRCLLYKCKSAAVVALMLGTDGHVKGTFELLKHNISSEFLDSSDENDDVYSISGPYTLWTELGMIYRMGTTYFRVACVGRSNRNNQPKLLCIDFNERETKITEIKCSLDLALNTGSFDGLGAFTSPIMYDENSQDQHMTGERTFLCALTSSGNLHIFGEDLIDMVPMTRNSSTGDVVLSNVVHLISISDIVSIPTKKFPLTVFEQLINISENDSLLFSGQALGIDSKELKSKLSRDSSSSFVCPRREGCGMTISLSKTPVTSVAKPKTTPSSLVISAIRVLVGSSPNHMPSRISVQGRLIDITPNLKRWYNVPLTEEEIARGIRTGLVSLWIGPSFDPTSAPIIDSVEVYASERKPMKTSIPRGYFAPMSTPTLLDSSTINKDSAKSLEEENREATCDGLVHGVRATTNMCELMGPSVVVSDTGKELLSQLIQVTTVHPDKKLGESLQVLANRLESDPRARWSLQDENMLVGCSRSLDECKSLLGESSKYVHGELNVTEDLKWKVIRMVLKDCLKVSALIAKERPNNYLQSMGNMQENNLKSGSIAIEASKLILEGLKNSTGFDELIGGNSGIVTLSLTEMAIVVYMDDSTSTKDFIQITQIRDFLDVANSSTCEAISTFFQDNESEKNRNRIPDLFVQMEAARRVAYQCDSCGICPMKEVRYTILEEDYGMDLCNKCYEVGKAFASKQSPNSSVEVVINGKSMGINLTCAHMKKMEPVSLERMEMDVEELDISQNQVHQNESEMSEENFDSSQQDLSGDHRGYDYFLGELYSFVMEQLSHAFQEEKCNSHTESLIKLVLDLIKHSKRNVLKRQRAACFVKDISKGISNILNSSSRNQKLSRYKISTLVTCLRGLSSLTIHDSKSEFQFPSSKSRDRLRSQALTKESKKTKFVCDVHRIPAVRRRCDKPGPDKDRRFYVCGKEKGQRCNYFKWAEDVQKETDVPPAKSEFCKIVRESMLDFPSSSDKSIFDRLCILLEEELFGDDGNAYEDSILASNTKEKKCGDSLLGSFYGVQDMKNDFDDGVFCSKEKLLDVVSGEALLKTELMGTSDLSTPTRALFDRGGLLLECSLDLLTLIADHKTDGISRWFSILCEIAMATNKHSSLRSLATKVLKALCDGNRRKYHYVRDHYTFCFQLKRLYYFSYRMLESGLIVKEKARQCGLDWKDPPISWSSLGACDLIGTQDLISEDSITESDTKGCGKALDEMWAIIKNRGGSWRQFCGFQSLPLSYRNHSNSSSNSNKNQHNIEKQLSEVPPIKVLFWIASSLTGINQVKLLRMIDFALIDWKGRKSSLITASSNDEDRRSQKQGSDDDTVILIGSANSKPEEFVLKTGNGEMVADDIVPFCLHLVLGGKTIELRRIAHEIASKLSHAISCEERIYLFNKLVSSIANIGIMGKSGVEFLTLLQHLSQYLQPAETVGRIADFIADSLMQQLDAIKYDRSNGQWIVLETNVGSSVIKKKFDVSGCHYCIKPQHFLEPKVSNNKPSERRASSHSARVVGRSGASVGAGSTSAPTPRQKVGYEQVSPYSRCRLDMLKESCVSNEFNHFYKLKHRHLVSDIHLSVSDPRGRYVKTISVFVTQRPLSGSLKSDRYDSKWQKIARLNLARGGSRASVSLPKPIIAANIRVEFTEFYERPGNKEKEAGGSMVLHCPRCTRPVTNAHGVCVSCGEVAFQCRKCRHINYDRLDAFLCVECGYTCCGSFSLDLNSAVVTNAIAITNDTDFDKSNEMYGAASSFREELKEGLSEKLRSLNKKNQNDTETDSFDDLEIAGSFLGLLDDRKDCQDSRLLDRFDKPGSVVKQVARPDNNSGGSGMSDSTPNRSERARSLLRLARQIRSEASSSLERRRSTDIIIRHLGRVSLQNLEDENELLDILESGTNQEQDDAKNSDDKDPKDKGRSRKTEIEECRKLSFLLREASRESYELRRRIDAWNNLNSGVLVETTPLDRITDGSLSFSPSHCSICGGSTALHLLVLWLKLFLVAPAHVHVNEEFFLILFQDDSQQLREIKGQVIISIATNSRHGAEMVLKELEKRLKASKDMYCAGILGKIMEIEGFVMIDEYAKLAMAILSSQAHLV